MNAKVVISKSLNKSTKATPLSVQLAIKTAEVRDSLSRIVKGLDGFFLQEDKNADRVDVLVLCLDAGCQIDSECRGSNTAFCPKHAEDLA